MISGFSGGASAVSGMSGISALTDPISSISNTDNNGGQARAARHAIQLDRIRHNWASPIVTTSDTNTATIQMLGSSTGLGSSLNHSSGVLRGGNPSSALDNDNMSWTGHSLNGGGIVARDDSVLFEGGTGSNLSAEGIYSSPAVKDDTFSSAAGEGAALGLAYGSNSNNNTLGSSRHSSSSRPGLLRGLSGGGTATPRGPAAYYPGDAGSVTSMSMMSAGVDSLPSMSELSDNMIALDLACGSILDQM